MSDPAQMPEKTHNLLIWDSEGPPPPGYSITVLWSKFGDETEKSVVSIPRYVENHGDILRKRYLEWIHELSESSLGGKDLKDYLELRPGFSYWWMTRLAQKSYFNSPSIYDAVRLLALERVLEPHLLKQIVLVSPEKTIALAIKSWCEYVGIKFEWRKVQTSSLERSMVKRIYDLLPNPVRGSIWLARYILQQWPSNNTIKNYDKYPSVTFVDYFNNFSKESFQTGVFASNYWANLVDVINQKNKQAHWLHLYCKDKDVRTTEQAGTLIARFNSISNGGQIHSMLVDYLDIHTLYTALKDYFLVVWRSLSINRYRRYFKSSSDVDLWPICKNEWYESLRGPTAIANCISLCLFENILSQLPPQKIGVFLQENMAWEMAFIHAWQSLGHGRLIGVPHGTIRHWDLRYFGDPRSYNRSGKHNYPMPDNVALNGPAAIKEYTKIGYPENQILEVEALRFLYLETTTADKKRKLDDTPLRVLVCGDYMNLASRQMMRWLEKAMPHLPPDTIFTVKPHPDCPISSRDYPDLSLQMTDAPLSDLLTKCDVVFTSNKTSASVDAYCHGSPVIQVLDASGFNFSPLRGHSSVAFVTNPIELAQAVRSVLNCSYPVPLSHFCIDRELPRWQLLLDLDAPL